MQDTILEKMEERKARLEKILENSRERLKAIDTIQDAEDVRIKVLGKKGELTEMLKSMGKMDPEERKEFGMAANQVRSEIEKMLDASFEQLKNKAKEAKFKMEKIDVTEPGKLQHLGTKHPITITIEEISKVFKSMGFSLAEGPEVETVFNNFDALNAGPNHPARDWTDTFYINDNVVLRTQTSSVQIRTMEQRKPPIRIISPGRVYRSDAVDATHSPLFHQIEGLVIDKGVTLGDLYGTLDLLMKKLYGKDAKIRLRPHHFPYTEPSAEVDLVCFNCGGKGCSMCKGEGYVELLGSGMVHPEVLRGCGIDPEVYSGFAFGIGLERITMGRYNINDMRMLYENDMRFLSQF